jgi:hypothetical protein
MPSHPHKHHGADAVVRGAGVTRVGIVTDKMRKGQS